MPNYKADLDWLGAHHPDEYAKIPQYLLTNHDWIQQHCSVLLVDGTDLEHWVILFAPRDEESDEAVVEVELGIPRPEPDDMPGLCTHHTLRASREYCPVCREL